jgi:hypothetical protein
MIRGKVEETWPKPPETMNSKKQTTGIMIKNKRALILFHPGK